MNTRLTQQAIRQAARVGSNLKQSAEAFVEQEVGPLRSRVSHWRTALRSWSGSWPRQRIEQLARGRQD
jgi:hypothetical protein